MKNIDITKLGVGLNTDLGFYTGASPVTKQAGIIKVAATGRAAEAVIFIHKLADGTRVSVKVRAKLVAGVDIPRAGLRTFTNEERTQGTLTLDNYRITELTDDFVLLSLSCVIGTGSNYLSLHLGYPDWVSTGEVHFEVVSIVTSSKQELPWATGQRFKVSQHNAADIAANFQSVVSGAGVIDTSNPDFVRVSAITADRAYLRAIVNSDDRVFTDLQSSKGFIVNVLVDIQSGDFGLYADYASNDGSAVFTRLVRILDDGSGREMHSIYFPAILDLSRLVIGSATSNACVADIYHVELVTLM